MDNLYYIPIGYIVIAIAISVVLCYRTEISGQCTDVLGIGSAAIAWLPIAIVLIALSPCVLVIKIAKARRERLSRLADAAAARRWKERH